MSENRMRVLSRSSILDLRAIGDANPKKVWETPLEALIAEYTLETVEVGTPFERGYEFTVGGPRDRAHDEHNSSILRLALPQLTPSQATDQRIWTTLALGDFKDYVLKRWAPAEGGVYPIELKVFVKDTRSLVRDHSISRLWWRAHFADQIEKRHCEHPLELFFKFEDLPGEIAGRSILTDSRVMSAYVGQIDRGLEAISDEQEREGLTPKAYIQGLGRNLNFLAGRFELGAVTDQRLAHFLQIAHRATMAKYLTA